MCSKRLIRIIFLLIILCYSPVLVAQSYLQFEYGTTSRQCGYPGYTFDMNKIFETAKKYPNPKILLVTPQERREVEEEIKLWNEQRKEPRKGIDPCSTCSQEYEACIVFDYLDANISNCSNWKEWRDDWDQKVHALIDEGLNKFAWMDPNSYTLKFRLEIGPDGKVVRIEPPQGSWQTPDPNSSTPPYTNEDIADFAKNGPKTLSDMTKWIQEKLSKIQACPFPDGSRLTSVERTPSVFHNVKGQVGHKSSPIPREPATRP